MTSGRNVSEPAVFLGGLALIWEVRREVLDELGWSVRRSRSGSGGLSGRSNASLGGLITILMCTVVEHGSERMEVNV